MSIFAQKQSAMDIKKAQFVISAPTVSMCPKDNKPEFAFIGRSNVGKSSLINMLCNHKGNHFIINNEWYLVDLPGYGYAKRSKTVQDKLDKMIRSYILQREQLCNVFVLIDIRHEQQKIDREFVDWLGASGIPFSIVFTKADKLGPVKAKVNAKQWMDALLDTWETLPPYFITSSEKQRKRQEKTRFSTTSTKSSRKSKVEIQSIYDSLFRRTKSHKIFRRTSTVPQYQLLSR